MSYSAIDLTLRTGTATYLLGECVELEARANFTGDEYEDGTLEVECDGQPFDVTGIHVTLPGFFATRKDGMAVPTPLELVLIGMCQENTE